MAKVKEGFKQYSNNYRLQSSTLVESVVGMVIISVAFAIGLLVVEMVLNSNKAAFKYRIARQINELSIQTSLKDLYMEETFDGADFTIEKKIIPYEQYHDLYQLTFSAYDLKGKLVLEQKELIYLP